MGYDRDRLRGAVDRLGRQASSRTANDISAASRNAFGGECLSGVPALAPRATRDAAGAPEGLRTGRWWAKGALAVVVGAAFVGLIVLPVSEAVVGRWSGTSVAKIEPSGVEPKLAEGDPARDSNSGSPDKAKLLHRTKIAMLEKCAAADSKGPCGNGKPSPTGDKEPPLPKHEGSKDGSIATNHKSPELPRHAAQSSGDRPFSSG